ncbi:hypothetical protein niasHT_008014 [Heterodera trifolii]|uniref:DUF7515 domain-containing protein n=1 Tax=Heterodera trifolii TaxID=157864 RepID=A0ABD2LZQ4_9BILA
MSSRFSTSDESSSSSRCSPNSYFDFVSGILSNQLKKFRSQIFQTLQSQFLGYESLSSLINAFVSDYGFDPVIRAKAFGYYSLYEFLASDYMKGLVFINFKDNGEAIFKAIPGDESKHIFIEQRIWHYYREKKSHQLFRRRCRSIGSHNGRPNF